MNFYCLDKLHSSGCCGLDVACSPKGSWVGGLVLCVVVEGGGPLKLGA